MDELFQIEKHIGEVAAIIGLQFQYEKEYIQEDEVEYEVFPEPEVAPVRVYAEGEEPEESAIQEEAAAEDGENPVPKFKVEDYRWTVTNARPKNLPQLFMHSKGINAQHEVRTAEQYSSSQYEAISKCLDEFCGRLSDASFDKYLYQQVIFNE